MIDAAQTSVHIAQQDIGPPQDELNLFTLAPWPKPTLAAIGRAVARGVDVTIVVSNPGKKGGYGHGWSLNDVVRQIVGATDSGMADKLQQNLCAKLHLAGARGSDSETWSDGKGYALHSKIIMIDERAFYLGSQNIYTANLQEFGFIFDDETAAKALLKDYYAKLWGFSSKGVMDGAGHCGG
jgi:phosphatidylserine/phosphatidylglycerophosphate/cardiolipin synthase-like enzyme